MKTYPLSTIKISPLNPDDFAWINIFAMAIRPNKCAANAQEHQVRIHELIARLTGALDEAGVRYQVEAIEGTATKRDRLNFNANVMERTNENHE